ncbi:hypothetical protein EG329_010763 [Mollisiaceae sp. DMI_Dod_QoI]|nr:hypothetical protein EG329_010763 [Helotiales sp. DMI_Dod_QoI]
MRFSTISAILAFAASTYAQTAGFDAITAPTQDQNVAAGSTLDIIWEPSANYTGTVTITLLEGATPSTLEKGPVIKAGIENSDGKFSWSIPSDVGTFATFGFTISLDSDPTIFQYSFPFHITGATGSSSTSSGSTTASAASTKTMTLSTGTAYTPSITATSSANITSILSTASFNATTLSTASVVKPTGNATLTFVSTATGAGSTATKSGSATATSSGPAAATTNAAVSNMASGSLAMIGGLVLALAL